VADLLFVSIVVAFFAIAVVLVWACDRIIGPDPVHTIDDVADLEHLDDLIGSTNSASVAGHEVLVTR
jgi:hypothetical protein